MTTLHLYLYRPKQLRNYLATKLEPLKIVFRLKCWLLGFHNFGVDEVPRHRCWNCGKKRMVPDEIRDAEERLRRVTHPHAWMRRTNVNGHYFYDSGIGPRVLALNCAFPDRCQNLASYAFDHKCRQPIDGMFPFGGLVSG